MQRITIDPSALYFKVKRNFYRLMENPASNDISQSLDSTSPTDSEAATKEAPTPLRCFTGALTSGAFSLLAYRLFLSIAASFASKPIVSSNPIAVNISAAVRTLVTGMVALGAGVFGVAALGLAGLGIQLLLKKDTQEEAVDS